MVAVSLRRLLPAVMAVMLLVAPGLARAADVAQARAAVQSAVDEGIATFVGTRLPLAERSARLESLLRRYVDPPMLSASILGRHWNRITPDEQKTFSELFVRYLVTSYVGVLGRAEAGTTLKVTDGIDQGSRAKVLSVAALPSQPGVPIPVEWDVALTADGRPAIMDLTAQGVSLIRAMRDDFASVLRSSGGRIEPLLDALKRKIDANEAENARLG